MNVNRMLCRFGLSAILCSSVACRKSEESEKSSRSARCKFHGRVDKDVTLRKACSPYIVRGGIDVLGDATLTIEPGVELRFGKLDWLEIAAAGTRGARLIARGSPEEPIVLTWLDSKNSSARSFLGLWFNAGTRAGSILSNAIIRGGGGDNKHIKPTLVQGCITVTDVADGAVAIENVVLENCVNAGVVLVGSRPNMTGLRLVDTKVGFLLDRVAPDAVPAAVTYQNVQQPVVEGAATVPNRDAGK